jgi:hypothetical protein
VNRRTIKSLFRVEPERPNGMNIAARVELMEAIELAYVALRDRQIPATKTAVVAKLCSILRTPKGK